MRTGLEIRVNSLNHGEDYAIQWKLYEETGEILSTVKGISCLEADLEKTLESVADGIWVDLPQKLQVDYLKPNEGDQGVFTVRFSKNPGEWGAVITDELNKLQKSVRAVDVSGDTMGTRMIFRLVAQAIAEKLDPTLQGRYVFENGEARVNPDYVQPPVTRYFP